SSLRTGSASLPGGSTFSTFAVNWCSAATNSTANDNAACMDTSITKLLTHHGLAEPLDHLLPDPPAEPVPVEQPERLEVVEVRRLHQRPGRVVVEVVVAEVEGNDATGTAVLGQNIHGSGGNGRPDTDID